MAIKAGAARPWAEDAERWATTWYEPHADVESLERGIRFALSVPGVVAFCTPGDVSVLPKALECATRFEPMTAAERDDASRAVAHEEILRSPR
jgi:hypothetical protein